MKKFSAHTLPSPPSSPPYSPTASDESEDEELVDEEEEWTQQQQQQQQQQQNKNNNNNNSDDASSEDDMSLASVSPSPPRRKLKSNNIFVRPSSTPMRFECDDMDFDSLVVEVKQEPTLHQDRFWNANDLDPSPWAVWIQIYPYLVQWEQRQLQLPSVTARSKVAIATYNQNYNSTITAVKSGIVLFFNFVHKLHYLEDAIGPDDYAFELCKIHEPDVQLAFFNFMRNELHYAPSTVRNHIEYVLQLVEYQLKYVAKAQEKTWCQQAIDSFHKFASIAKQEETAKRHEFLNIENIQKLGLFLTLEQLQAAAKYACNTLQYYMKATIGLKDKELYKYVTSTIWNKRGKRWVSIQKAVMYLLFDLCGGQRTQNLVSITTDTLVKSEQQYVFTKLPIEKNQNRIAEGLVMRSMKQHYLPESFTPIMDFWARVRKVLVHKKEHKHWFLTFNYLALKNSDKFVLLFKEITFELFGKAFVPKMFRKNMIHHALENASNDEEVQLVAELASHNATTAKEYYQFKTPRKDSSKVHVVLNKVSSAQQFMNALQEKEDDEDE